MSCCVCRSWSGSAAGESGAISCTSSTATTMRCMGLQSEPPVARRQPATLEASSNTGCAAVLTRPASPLTTPRLALTLKVSCAVESLSGEGAPAIPSAMAPYVRATVPADFGVAPSRWVAVTPSAASRAATSFSSAVLPLPGGPSMRTVCERCPSGADWRSPGRSPRWARPARRTPGDPRARLPKRGQRGVLEGDSCPPCGHSSSGHGRRMRPEGPLAGGRRGYV